MSVPLPPCRYYTDETSGSRHVGDIFLDADERYEIYEVKSLERHHLLSYNDEHEQEQKHPDESCSSTDIDKEEKAENIDDDMPKPLIDGCDIPGWRREKLVTSTSTTYGITPNQQAILNIGASSTMFRRERQWPVYGQFYTHLCRGDSFERKDSPWSIMRRTLSCCSNIRRKADIIHYDEYKKLIPVNTDDGEETNTPRGNTSRMVTKFAIEFEQRNIPVVILGATVGWECMPTYLNSSSVSKDQTEETKSQEFNHSFEDIFSGDGVGGWTFSNLLNRFRNVCWRFSDTHGAMMSFGTYAKYITNLEGLLDDSPLGIYDSEFGDEDSPTHKLLEEYEVPSCFSPDLFDLATTRSYTDVNVDDDDSDNSSYSGGTRPPYRWILIGPERSGTGMHIDPLWTNAWVTVLQGKKRWMLFPPGVSLEDIGMIEGKPQINSATWFKHYYDKVVSDEWPEEWRPVEVLQSPGETVFVPNGWPHLVLNLELTVAVTHNYASEFGPFERMWEEVSIDEPDFAARWLEGMKNHRPDLVKRLRQWSSGNK